MTDKLKDIPDRPCSYPTYKREISMFNFWQVVWKRRKMIGYVAAATVLCAFIISLFVTNIYQAKAIIIPVVGKDSGSSSGGLAILTQQLGGSVGIPMPSSANASEIVSLLNSNILRKRIIEQHNLLPILFYKKWDQKLQNWKKGYSILGLNPFKSNIPDIRDGLRLLEDIVKINRNSKDNTITISVNFHDPELAAKIADYYLLMLTNYMSSEAKRVAAINRKYLEEQLGSTTDPFIKQKTYNMIAQQIENGMMAEVKENFAFKVIDPPMAPDKKIEPQRVLIVLLSLVVSLLIGIGIAQFQEYYEKEKKKTREVGK